MIYILTLFFLIALIICYFLFNKEITVPSIIFCCTYFLSTLCTCLNVNEWGVKLQFNTFLVFFLGTLEFIIINYLIYNYFKNRFKNKKNKKNEQIKEIKINKKILILIIVYEIVVLLLLYKNVLSIASEYGKYNSFSEALTIYKDVTSYKSITRLPRYLTLLMKPIVSSAYVAVFIFFNNLFTSKKDMKLKIKENIIYCIFPTLYIVQRIIESNRGSILNLGVSLIVMAIIFWSMSHNWKKAFPLKRIWQLLLLGIIGLIVFYYSASLVGRINNKNMYRYITFYAGGSIECFNIWLNRPDKIESFRGEYTFGRTINDLYDLKLTNIHTNNKNYSSFIYYKNKMVGNIYTSYRPWIHDFGIIGLVILQGLLSAIFSYMYYIVRYNRDCKYHKFILLIYGYLIYTIFMHPIDSYFYLETFTKSSLLMFILMVLMLYISLKSNKIKTLNHKERKV